MIDKLASIWPFLSQFVPRIIEDTDLKRSTKESEEAVLRDLSWWSGLAWDEDEITIESKFYVGTIVTVGMSADAMMLLE